MLDKLAGIAARYDEVSRLITEPDVINDMKRYVQLNKEFKELTKVVAFYNEYKNVIQNIESSKKILDEEKDEEMREMAKEELDILNRRWQEMERRSRFFFYLLIRRMQKMQLLNSVPEPAVMRPVFLQGTFSVCTVSSVM